MRHLCPKPTGRLYCQINQRLMGISRCIMASRPNVVKRQLNKSSRETRCYLVTIQNLQPMFKSVGLRFAIIACLFLFGLHAHR